MILVKGTEVIYYHKEWASKLLKETQHKHVGGCDIGVCSIAVLQYPTIFSCSISEILILKRGIVVFSEPVKWGF